MNSWVPISELKPMKRAEDYEVIAIRKTGQRVFACYKTVRKHHKDFTCWQYDCVGFFKGDEK